MHPFKIQDILLPKGRREWILKKQLAVSAAEGIDKYFCHKVEADAFRLENNNLKL